MSVNISYVDLLNSFYGSVNELNADGITVDSSEIALFMALANVWNRLGRNKEQFPVSYTELTRLSGMAQHAIDRARARLQEKGLIEFTPSINRKAVQYRITIAKTAIAKTAIAETAIAETATAIAETAIVYSQNGYYLRERDNKRISVQGKPERDGDDDIAISKHSEPKAAPSPKRTRKNAGEETETFIAFYEAYPRHVDRAGAWKAWKKLDPDENLVKVILASVKEHERTEWARGITDGDLTHVPHPATFLNGKRWTDELTPRKTVPASGTSVSNRHLTFDD